MKEDEFPQGKHPLFLIKLKAYPSALPIDFFVFVHFSLSDIFK